jgi:hypothetical protein
MKIMQDQTKMMRRHVFATDLDQTLSFNDSAVILSELLGSCEL